jgi:hypothetical protein
LFSEIWDLSSGLPQALPTRLRKNVHEVSTLAAASSQVIFRVANKMRMQVKRRRFESVTSRLSHSKNSLELPHMKNVHQLSVLHFRTRCALAN